MEYTNGEFIRRRVLAVIKKIGIDNTNKIFANIFKVFIINLLDHTKVTNVYF